MSSREVVNAFWAAMQANDWDGAAGYLAPDCVIDWPCSGERIVGPSDFVSIQARYPTNTGQWSFEVHRLVADGTGRPDTVDRSGPLRMALGRIGA
jgi:limonene-1,2-epoxide hydrolase